MPSEKSHRGAAKKAVYNRGTRSRAKTAVAVARQAIAAGDKEKAQPVVVQAASSLDRAARKGSIHRNNASRRKSRLARQLAALQRPGE